MMRSLYSGVSGLKTHQTKMDVIGNNIANVNTTSYKTMSINFSDLMYQTTQAATGPNATTGAAGTNPRQIGLGVQTAAISTNITQEGATQSTGNPFDLKISGDEFFIVSDGSNTYFTRDGSFYVDAAGNLAMSSTGYNVMGWGVDEETGNIKKDTVKPLVIMGSDYLTYGAENTTAATASGIIDWNDDDQGEKAGKTLSLQIYDNLGYSYTVKYGLHNAVEGKEGKDYSFYVTLDSITDSTGKQLDISKVKFGSTSETIALDGMTYGVSGATVNTMEALVNGTTTTVAYAIAKTKNAAGAETSTTVILYPTSETFNGAVPTTFTSTDGKTTLNNAYALFKNTGTLNDNPNTNPSSNEVFTALYGDKISPADIQAGTVGTDGSLKITQRTVRNAAIINYSGKDGKFMANGSTGGENGATMDLTSLGKAFTNVTVDFSKAVVTDNSGKSTISLEKGDKNDLNAGRESGTLQGVSIQTNGMIYASYTNGQKRLLGQIAVTEFANASGLQKEGDNLYTATKNSGDFNGIGIDITENGDAMNTGVLEMSNVDLSSEFTDMITTQRGFQANSRIITVSDTLLEELVNLKR
ncbi:MAG: flagellar hook-basal body complex protein [Roseburia sp.]|nr:flagellar hook-basal body complex protein [Roseburia sp.]